MDKWGCSVKSPDTVEIKQPSQLNLNTRKTEKGMKYVES